MAILTLRAQRLLVNIVVQVTRFASRCEFDFENGFNMAIVAGYEFVTAEKLVLRVPVVIENRLIPGDAAAMAGVALITAMHFMRIVFEMTGYAGLIHFVFKRVLRMAVGADQFGMAS